MKLVEKRLHELPIRVVFLVNQRLVDTALFIFQPAVREQRFIWCALCVGLLLLARPVLNTSCLCCRSPLPKACLNTFKAVRSLLAKPGSYQLSLSYCEKASGLFRDSLNLGPHCTSNTLDKVMAHFGSFRFALVWLPVCGVCFVLDRAVVHCSCIACASTVQCSCSAIQSCAAVPLLNTHF